MRLGKDWIIAWFTHVVNHVGRVTTESEQSARAKGGGVAVNCLYDGHEYRRGQKTDPLLVEDGECLGTEVDDNAADDAERE